ncbi:MAG: AMP-binding protein [Hydrogenibacillus schlegelii]|uniref:AMP-binding protein n=1 Tax=Hydrogenibacillus schlegelii TaxID=1484 RepID=A0A947CWK1_HYDSH|nr:AMP-binding protein [Hydrogenibacillus schlegelii]
MLHSIGEEAYRLPRFARKALRARFRWEIPEFFNLSVDTVERWARRTPEREALVEPGGRTLTYGALADLAARLSAVFAARGIGKGDVVGVLVPPSVEAALAHLSLYRLGAVVLPLSPVFGEAALRYRLEHSGARALIVDRRSLDVHETLFRTAGVDAWPADRLPAWAEEARPANPAATRADDPALLVYTSGTTGPPKGALLPHRVLLGHLPGFYLYSNFPQFPARYWSPAEWAWVGGLLDVLFPAWFYGFTVIAYRAPKFDPEAAFRLLETYAVTHTFLFPTALKMMRASGYRPKRLALQSVHAGGEPLDPELQAWSAETFGLPINEFYGQTEANLLIGHCHPVDPLRPGSMGLAYPGHEVVLLDEAGAPVSPGTVGEIALRLPDPVAFLGY